MTVASLTNLTRIVVTSLAILVFAVSKKENSWVLVIAGALGALKGLEGALGKAVTAT